MHGGSRAACGWWVALLLLIAADATADQRLVEAAKQQEHATVRMLLEQRVDVNEPQPDGATALHWAIHWGNLEAARLLADAGANVNAANEYGVTPLLLACGNGDTASATLLLKAGADPNVSAAHGETPLITAASAGSTRLVEVLLAAGAQVNATEQLQEQTALMWAVAAGHSEVARILVEHGADVRARSSRGYTPLLLAARAGDAASARLLLDAGADVNEAASDRLSPLIVATVRDHAALAVFLLEHGADPNAAGAGYTALHWAAGVWETELTGPRGIAIERDEEWRALRGVRTAKHALVAALLAHGADPDARITRAPQRVGFTRGGLNLVGATPFLVAAAGGDAVLMQMLAANGANPLLATDEQTTPVMAAAGNGRVAAESRVAESRALEALELAIELGGDVYAVNDAGDTALHGAASLRWNVMVQKLVDRGAAVDVKNKRGRTPLMNAAGSSTADLLRMLGAVDPAADSIR